MALYVEWQLKTKHIPKNLRYSIGSRIENLMANLIENITYAYHIDFHSRVKIILTAIAKNDTLKFMIYALHELKGLDENNYFLLSEKVEEIGKMLHGWKNQIEKQNHQNK